MVLSSPVRRGTPVAAFCLGLVGGGLTTATAMVVLGSLLRAPLPEPARWALVGVALGVVLLREWGLLAFRLPENRRLVPESVFRLGRHLGPLQFGVEMGTGVRTYLPSGLPYAAGIAVLLTASVPAAVGAGLGFGLGRALMTTSALRFGPDDDWSTQWRRHGPALTGMVSAGFAVSVLGFYWVW